MVFIFKIFRLLSLDIVLGSVFSMHFASVLMTINPGIPATVILGVSVFIIYNLDHIFDRWTERRNGTHLKRLRLQRAALVSITLLAIPTVYFSFRLLPGRLFITGLVLGTMLVLYFLFIHFPLPGRSFFNKPVWISLIYTGATWGIPFSMVDHTPGLEIWILFSVFYMLVLSNVLVIKYYDKGGERIRQGVWFLLIFCLAGVLISNLISGFYIIIPSIIFLLMISLMAVTITFEALFRKNGNYAVLADFVFIFPGLIFLFG